jgi:hypothetical protein
VPANVETYVQDYVADELSPIVSDVSNLQIAVSALQNRDICCYFMQANATATTIANTANFVKANGTTTANAATTANFTHSNNKALYTGATAKTFEIYANATLTGTNANVLSVRIAVDGVTIAESEGKGIISGNTNPVSISSQLIVALAQNQYIEVFVRNQTSTQTVTAANLNVIIKELI